MVKRKNKCLFFSLLVIIVSLFIIVGCSDDETDPVNPPTLTTLAVTEITETSAKSGGNVTDDGGSEITARGVVWSTDVNPSLDDHIGMTQDGTGSGVFLSEITDLSSATTYYIRAYSTNSAGTSYGNDVMFETIQSVFVLTLDVEPQEAGNATGAGEYPEGEHVNIAAIPGEGWEFVNWTGDTDFLDSPNSEIAIVTMPAENITLIANFVEEDGDNTEVVEVINPATGKTWMDRNLGASRAATSRTDAEAYGDLYQWGRAADGHQKRTSSTTPTLSSSDTPGHGSFILAPDSPWDWRNPQNDNLWQGVTGITNPCPPGYRLPTDAEWEDERASWISNDRDGAFASPLKLPVAGNRSLSDGSLGAVGSYGYYWSSTVNITYSRLLNFTISTAGMYSFRRAGGFSVRCFKDD